MLLGPVIKRELQEVKNRKERGSSQRQIQQEREFFEEALNSLQDNFLAFDSQTHKAIRWNEAFKQISGYSDEEIASLKAPDSYFGPEDLAHIKKVTKELSNRDHVLLEVELVTKAAKKIPIEYTITKLSFVYDAQDVLIAVGSDIRERKQNREILISERDKFKMLLKNTQGMVYRGLGDWSAEIVSGSGSEQLCGYTAEEFTRQSTSWLTLVHPDDMEQVVESSNQLKKRPGSDVRQYRIVTKGGEQRWVEDHVTSVFKDGEFLCVDGVAFDITEKKALQAQIAQSDRMASVGLMSACVAHEINNPLTYVLFNLDSLAQDLPELNKTLSRLHLAFGSTKVQGIIGPTKITDPDWLDEIVCMVEDAREGSYRIRDIVKDLRTFSRVEEERVVKVSLNDVVESAISMAHNEIKYRAKLVKQFGELPALMANDGELAQVFLNLLVNAAHSIEEGDMKHNEIRVKTWTEDDEVRVEVCDSGQGIPESRLGRVFEAFYTTKEVIVGSGLGLSICQDIVCSLGGRIDVESEVGKGSKFVVSLPVKLKAEAQPRTSAPVIEAQAPVARGRVLVIDDEKHIGKTIERILKKEHEVVLTTSGVEAKQLLTKDTAFDVILCDLMMPEMTGMDLYSWLREKVPVLAKQMVFMTGGVFTPKARNFLSHVPNLCLEKPLESETVSALVRERITG